MVVSVARSTEASFGKLRGDLLLGHSLYVAIFPPHKQRKGYANSPFTCYIVE